MPTVGQSTDFKTQRMLVSPAALYVMRHNLNDASGNALPTATPTYGTPATLASEFAADLTLDDSGMMDLVPDSEATAANTCVGLTNGGVVFAVDMDTVELESDQLRGIADEETIMTRVRCDVTLSELTLYNLALAFGRHVDHISQSSIFVIMASDQEHHSLKIVTKAPQNSFSNSTGFDNRADRVTQPFKVKAFTNGDVNLNRDAQSGVPVSFHCYCDGAEIWGIIMDKFTADQEIAPPLYNTDPGA